MTRVEIGAVAAGIAVAADVVGDEIVGGDVAVGRGIGVDAANVAVAPVAGVVVAVDTAGVGVGVGCCSTASSEQAIADTAIATQSASGSNRVKSIVDKINLCSLYSHLWRYSCISWRAWSSFASILTFPIPPMDMDKGQPEP